MNTLDAAMIPIEKLETDPSVMMLHETHLPEIATTFNINNNSNSNLGYQQLDRSFDLSNYAQKIR